MYKTDGTMVEVRSPQDLPDATRIDRIEEPYLKAKIIVPPEYTGAVMQLAIEHRGITTDMIHLSQKSVEMRFDMPLLSSSSISSTSSRAVQRAMRPLITSLRLSRERSGETRYPAFR